MYDGLGYQLSTEDLLAKSVKDDLLARQAADLAAAAQAGRSSLTKWVLYGAGGLLVLGVGVAWILSRRKNPRRRRR